MYCLDGQNLGIWITPEIEDGLRKTIAANTTDFVLLPVPFVQFLPFFNHGTGNQPTAPEEGDRANS